MTAAYSSRIIEIFIGILCSVVGQKPSYFPEDYDHYEKEILLLARRQEMTHLLYYAYTKLGRDIPEELEQIFLQQVGRDKRNQFLLEKTKEIFQKSGIQYVPLKGSVTKELYPESWMRSGCDIDILVHESSLNNAVRALVQEGFSTDYKKAFHDITLSYGGATLELHYNICENIPRLDKGLSEVWKNVVLFDKCEFRETPEFLAFHTTMHLLYHLIKGGCNIKAFIDLWLMRKQKTYDEQKLYALLKKNRFERFYRQLYEAIGVWFEGKNATEVSTQLEKLVLLGGLSENKQIERADIVLSGGTIKYIWSSFFLPYSDMLWIYPRLRKYPLLLPYYYGKRFFIKIFGEERQKTEKQIYEALHIKDKQNTELIDLMMKLGLD